MYQFGQTGLNVNRFETDLSASVNAKSGLNQSGMAKYIQFGLRKSARSEGRIYTASHVICMHAQWIYGGHQLT